MNKNFINTKAAVVAGVLLGGSLISYSEVTNSPINLYMDSCYATSKNNNQKNNIIIHPIISDSNISTITPISFITDDQDVILREFIGSIINHSKPLDSDFSSLIDDNFWDLV